MGKERQEERAGEEPERAKIRVPETAWETSPRDKRLVTSNVFITRIHTATLMNELEFKLGNRERITDYHSPGSVLYFFYFISNSYIHATYPHDFSRVAFILDNLRWG